MQHSRESLHEVALHGKKTFPYAVYHARIPEWLNGFPLHWHDEFEIIFVTYGCGIFTVNGKTYLCKKGDLILIPSGAVHSIERHGDDFIEYFNILFAFSLLDENTESHCYRKYFVPLLQTDNFVDIKLKSNSLINKKLVPLIQDLVDHRSENYSGYELMIKSRLYEILHIIKNENLSDKNGKAQSEREKQNSLRLKKILSYTALHFSEAISISQLAEFCSISPSRFISFFKEQTGMSYITYLNDYRLEAAAEELLQTKQSVTEIAAQNGFENPSYFIRSFKKKFFCTPTEYRKR